MLEVEEEKFVIKADVEGDYYEGWMNEKNLITPYFEEAWEFETLEEVQKVLFDLKKEYPDAKILRKRIIIDDKIDDE